MEYMTNERADKAKETDEEKKPGELAPGRARPVVIHRAIIGSFERFFGILIEHFGGKWPYWLSPRQIAIIPVMPDLNDYAQELKTIFEGDKMNVFCDTSANTLQKKVRNAQLAQYNFLIIVGAQERDSRSVNIRNRDDPATQNKGVMVPIDEAREKFKSLRKERRLENSLL